jgi:hypothetical protein
VEIREVWIKSNIPRRCKGTYNIGFDGYEETQFDTTGIDDLEELWRGFCKDEGIQENSVDYIERA